MVCPNESSELFATKIPFEVIFGLGVELGLVVGFGVGVGEAATAEVFVGVGVAVVAETVLVEDGEALGDRLGDAVVSICLISIPSSQTMFLPTFIAVYLRFRQIIVCPNFFGAKVGFGIVAKSLENGEIKRPKMMPRRRNSIFK